MFDFIKSILGKGKEDSSKEEPSTKKRTSIPEWVKYEVVKRQNNRCAMCGKFLTYGLVNFDHIVPVALGGTSELNNVQALCPDCHQLKTKFDMFLIRRAKEMSKSKRDVILKSVQRGWLFIGESPGGAGGNVPEWVLQGLNNLRFKLNEDGYPYSVVRGKTFEYLVVLYSKKNFLFFKRPRKPQMQIKKRRKFR